MGEIPRLRELDGSGSLDAVGDLQVLARGADGVHRGSDLTGDDPDCHDTCSCPGRYHVLPDQDLQSACLRRPGHALTADGRPVGVSSTAAQNLDPARCGTGQTPRSRGDPGLCCPAGCGTGYPNANDGCVL